MNKIQMVDLRSQYQKIKTEIDEAIQETINKSAFIKGAALGHFQEELSDYLNGAHVVTCANGTDALQVALMTLDLNPGDEVITSNFTFIATVEVISLLGLKPVLVDVDPVTFNLDPDEIEKVISPRTRAIIPVHLFGQAAPMAEILELSRKHNLAVVEDAAQAVGAKYEFPDGRLEMAGTIGEIGTASFFPSKNLGCFGDGGALFTRDKKTAERMQIICNHGSKVKYHHDVIGENSRLDTIQAAILRVKLKYLNDYNSARQKAAAYYDDKLKDHPEIITPGLSGTGNHIYHQYTIRIMNGKRDRLKSSLAKLNIPSMVYYPVPLSLQKAFRHSGYKTGDFKVTEQLCNEVLSLPMHTELQTDQQEFIVSSLLDNI